MLSRIVASRIGSAFIAVSAILGAARASAAEVTVCVNVRTRTWASADATRTPERASPARPGKQPAIPKARTLPTPAGHSGLNSQEPTPRENLLAQPLIPEQQTDGLTPDLPAAATEPQQVTVAQAPPAGSAAPKQATPDADRPPPPPFDEAAYLTRMFEYEVTHEVGFSAVKTGCQQRLDVELYPLRSGWTVFARYSGNQREEKIDSVSIEELAVLARRLTRALLRDVAVNETITRTTVLKADTEHRLRKIGVQGHVLFGLGSALRFGALPNADSADGAAQDEQRFLTPATILLGYRGKFQEWGLDAFVRGTLGITERTPNTNSPGGHVDYGGGLSLGLHFLHYFDADGITSLYAGGGASFELTFLTMIRPEGERADGDRDTLVSGGLNMDLVAGYEFMRASAVHFFGQLELNLPTYGIRLERTWGIVDTYLPGAVAHIGVIF
jgi:hypothetical protein